MLFSFQLDSKRLYPNDRRVNDQNRNEKKIQRRETELLMNRRENWICGGAAIKIA